MAKQSVAPTQAKSNNFVGGIVVMTDETQTGSVTFYTAKEFIRVADRCVAEI